MTAARAQLAAPSIAPTTGGDDWTMWISAADAAPLLGVSAGHMRRVCAEELAARGLAKHAPPPATSGGGNPRWWVHRNYSIKLTAGIIGAHHQVPALEQYTEKQRRTAWARVDCVRRFRRRRDSENRPQGAWIAQLAAELQLMHEPAALRVSPRSLRRWDATYRNPADVERLIDGRGGDQKSQGDPAAWAYFAHLYCQDTEPTIRYCWRKTKAQAKRERWSWCSYESCRRQKDQRIAVEQQVRTRQPDRWRKTMQPTGEFKPDSWAAGAKWEADHKQLDMMVRVEVDGRTALQRPWLTAFKDWRTRRVVGWCLSLGPNADTILAALRMAMLDPANYGGPDEVHFDNGKDFDAFMYDGRTKTDRLTSKAHRVEADEPTFRGIFGLLGIEISFAIAHNPNGKSRTERWFRVLDDFCRDFPSYTGRSVATKPETLRRVEARPALAPTFDACRDELARFIDAWNASAEHSINDLIDPDARVKLSPNEAMDRWRGDVLVKPLPAAIDLCLQHWHKPVRVGRNGIRFAPYGGVAFTYGKFAPELIPFKGTGRALYVSFDPADLSQVKVWDDKLAYVATLQRDEKGARGDRDQVKRLMKAKRQRAQAMKMVADTRHWDMLTAAQIMEEQNAERPAPPEGPQDPGDGPDFKLHQTPLDDALNAVENDQLRLAAGAEHLSGGGRADEYDLLEDDDTLQDVMAQQREGDDDDYDFDFGAGAYPTPAAVDDFFEDDGAAVAPDDDDSDTDVDIDLLAPSALRLTGDGQAEGWSA